MKKVFTALALLLGLASPAFAAHVQSCTGVLGSNSVNNATAFCTTATPIKSSDAAVGFLQYYNPTVNSLGTITDDQGGTYVLLDNQNHFTHWYTQTFVRYGITNGPVTITAHFSGGTTTSTELVWDEYSGVNGTDNSGAGHTSLFTSLVSTQTGAVSSGNITTTTAGDTIYGVALPAAEIQEATVGSGFMQEIYDSQEGIMTEDKVQSAVGAVDAHFTSAASDSWVAFMVAMKPAIPPPVPVSVSCTPAVLLDNAANGTSVCPFTVTMSDMSTYSGTTQATPTNLFALTSGGSPVKLARALTSTDDGTATLTITATQNGVSVNPTFNVQINPTAVSGTPFALGWKNIDPGQSAMDGSVFVTMPKTGTVTEVAMRVVNPAGSPALVDVYHAAPGQACLNGSKLHVGDLNANMGADSLQVLTGSNLTNTSLAVGDSICLVTQQPFPANGEATITVTVQ
jgi:hypothetical protein